MTEKSFKKFNNNSSFKSTSSKATASETIKSSPKIEETPKVSPKIEESIKVEPVKNEEFVDEKIESIKPIKNVPTFNKSSNKAGSYVNVKLLRRKKGR